MSFGFGLGFSARRGGVSSLEARYNATASYNAAAGVVLSGADVTCWQDQVGAAHLTAPAGAEPTYVASDPTYGGQPVITLDGTQWLDADLFAAAVDCADSTFVFVGEIGGDSYTRILAHDTNAVVISRSVSGTYLLFRLTATGYYLTASVTDTAPHVTVVKRCAGVVRWLCDGVEIGVNIVDTPAASVNGLAAGAVGCSTTLGELPMTGKFHRLWWSNAGMTDSDQDALCALLQAEVGL